MKTLATFFFFAIISLSLSAQYEDVVFLKNGSQLKGKILEIKPNESVTYKTPDGNLWVFSFAEIEKFDLKQHEPFFKRDTLKSRFFVADVGFLVGTVQNDVKAPLSFQSLYGFNLTGSLYAGIGTGLEFYQMTYIPLILDMRLKPFRTGISLFIQGGPVFPLSDNGKIDQIEYEFKRGYFFNPGISYTFKKSEEAAFTVGIGYRYQYSNSKRIDKNYYYYYDDIDYQIINKLNRFVIRFGYTF